MPEPRAADARRGMKVTVLGLNYAPEPTGIAPYTARMAAGLRDRGHDVAVVTSYPHYPQWRVQDGYSGWSVQERADGMEVLRVRHYVPRRPVGVARALSEVTFGVASSVRSWGKPDVVVCVSPALLSTAVSLGRIRGSGHGRPAVGVVMQDLYSVGIVETGGGPRSVARALTGVESWVARRADGVAVIHDRLRSRIVETLGVPAERVTTVRNWTHVPPTIDVDREATRRSLGWNDDETVVLHAGAMGEKQALGNVVEAARLAERDGTPVRFVLMGDGGGRPRLEEAAAGLTRIQFLDPVADEMYPRVLRSADLLLVNERPGVADMAVPSKLTSYFSTGLPVLAATGDDSTTAEEIRASGAGVVVAPGKPRELLDDIRALVADPVEARALGSNGPSYCRDVLSEDVALDAYDAWVRGLYDRRNQREGRR